MMTKSNNKKNKTEPTNRKVRKDKQLNYFNAINSQKTPSTTKSYSK